MDLRVVLDLLLLDRDVESWKEPSFKCDARGSAQGRVSTRQSGWVSTVLQRLIRLVGLFIGLWGSEHEDRSDRCYKGPTSTGTFWRKRETIQELRMCKVVRTQVFRTKRGQAQVQLLKPFDQPVLGTKVIPVSVHVARSRADHAEAQFHL